MHLSCFTDPEIVEELQPWKKIVDEQGNRLVAFSNVYLKKSDCTVGECNIGSLVTDSYVHAVRSALWFSIMDKSKLTLSAVGGCS